MRDIPAALFYSPGMARPKLRHVSGDEQELLEHLQVRPLTSPQDTARCDELILEHHYLHNATLVGEQLRYVATYKGRWLAVATWSAATFHLKDRDEFIGWESEQRRRRLPLLANNSRLLVLPEGHSPNLISRFMKLMLGRLSQDWLERWGHPLALVESFVDPQLYQGTAYKVSGWSHLGKTAGWKRDAADFYLKHDAPKQIWVRELVKKACVKLRAPQLPPEWAMVEEAARAHCTTPVKEIRSLRDSVRQELPEFRRAQALGYPLAGMICLMVMALATGVRQGPEDLAQFADTLTQAQLRALGFRQDRHTRLYRCPKKTTFTRVLAGVDAAKLQPILLDWQRRRTGPIQDSLVVIDGKKMRHGGVEMVNATDGNGVPGHTLAMVVEGGSVQAIVNAIGSRLSIGCGTYGNTSGVYVDPNYGFSYTIFFSIPTQQTIVVQITKTALTGYTTAIGVEIQNAVAAYINSLGIGQSVLLSRVYAPALLQGPFANPANPNDALTYEITSLLIAISPGAVGSADLTINWNQVAICAPADVTIL